MPIGHLYPGRIVGPVRQTKPALLIAALAAAIATAARRRQAQHDAEILWREATSDASR